MANRTGETDLEAAGRLYEAELALHAAHRMAVDAWIAAAADGLLDLARRRWGRAPATLFRVGLGDSAFGEYVIQAPVIAAVSLAVRPVPLPALAKLTIAAAVSLATCFGLAHAASRAAGRVRSRPPIGRQLRPIGRRTMVAHN